MRISDWSSDVCSSDLRRQYEIVFLGVEAGDQAGEFGALDLDLAAHALGQLLAAVDIEALQAATQFDHGMRREGGIEAGAQRFGRTRRRHRDRHGRRACGQAERKAAAYYSRPGYAR